MFELKNKIQFGCRVAEHTELRLGEKKGRGEERKEKRNKGESRDERSE